MCIKWIKRNPELSIGIGVPLLLTVFFLMANTLPQLWVAPPKYDVLFLTNVHTPGVRYEIKQGKVSFAAEGVHNGYNWPKLYRYQSSNGAIKEITIPIPPAMPRDSSYASPQNQKIETFAIPMPELETLTLDNSSISPDGYEFRSGQSNPVGFLNVFTPTSDQRAASITKEGRVIALNPSGDIYYYNGVKLLGWVMHE